jgi:hypothetical protein
LKQAIIVVGDKSNVEALVSTIGCMSKDIRMAVLGGRPTLRDALDRLHSEGVDRVALVPFTLGFNEEFLSQLNEEVDAARSGLDRTEITISSPLCPDRRIAGILDDRADQVFLKLDGMAGVPILRIGGKNQVDLTYQDLCVSPGQIEDVSKEVPGRRGQAVRIRHLLDTDQVPPKPKEVVFQAGDDEFSARVSFDLVKEKGLFLYRIDGEPLPESQGGPLRLLIPGINDRCSNVKNVVRMQLI